MPSEGTKRQSFRLDQAIWDAFAASTARAVPPTDRTEVLKQFIRWYNRERGVKRPERPEAPAGD